MGRHRRSAAGRATGDTGTDASATGNHVPQRAYGDGHRAPGIAPYPDSEAYAEIYARSNAYLFATDEPESADGGSAGFTPDGGSRRAGTHRRRRRRAVTPVRTGLLGVSAAVALGAVAVATGVLPGGPVYRLGGTDSDKVQSAPTAGNVGAQQGGTSGAATEQAGRDAGSAGRDPRPSASPSTSASASPSPSASATPTEPPAEKKKPTATPSKTARKPEPTPSQRATEAPVAPSTPPVTVSAQAAAEAEVLRLVNAERAQAGCSPLAANSALTDLARAFSQDMAERGFFDHTDPDGATPWDRAEKAGITDLGGENIARGQADAAAVMAAWMDSPGHRANILNCDFKTLGVGVHYGEGGPWWTQDFGY
ncbi:CAP domain-containing protein [Streptomyces sp. enrichment culture]|uniref:CAP domain-containing protein n=1 Tax=Streptomyces sp. enrichment culture TaxID=1795815 RepID=UPI003F54AC44